MPYGFIYMWNLKNKHKNNIETNSQMLREQSDGCLMGGGWEGRVTKVKGFSSPDWQLQNRHGDVKFSISYIVNNTVITMDGARWYWNFRRDHFISYTNI